MYPAIKQFTFDGASHLFKLYSVKKDGSCLFNFLSLGLFGTEKYALKIRRDIVKHVVKNFEFYGNFMAYTNKEQYLTYMNNIRSFGTYNEVVAASAVFKVRIIVFRHNILICDVGKGYFDKTLVSDFSGNINAGHFDLAWPINNEFHKTVLPYTYSE